MIRENYPFSSFKAGAVESTKLEEEVQADTALPKYSHIETRKPADEDGVCTIIFATDAALTRAQKSALDDIVAAHDSEAAALQLTRDNCKGVIDLRTTNYQAIRLAAAMTEEQIDDEGKATKDAIDAATTIEGCIAAADADPRPVLNEPVGRLSGNG